MSESSNMLAETKIHNPYLWSGNCDTDINIISVQYFVAFNDYRQTQEHQRDEKEISFKHSLSNARKTASRKKSAK